MAWRIEFDGQVYREADLTIGQAERIEELTGTDWRFINPVRSAKQARAVLAVMVADRAGIPLDEATTKVRAITVNAFADMIAEDDEDDLPTVFEDGFPQTADGTSTTT